MIHSEFAKGTKDIGLVIGNKYYNWKDYIGRNYGIPLNAMVPDLIKRLVTISTFERADGKKPTKKELQPHLEDLLESSDTMGLTTLLVANAEYFKILSGSKTFEDQIGYTFNCVIVGYEHITILPILNAAILGAQPGKSKLYHDSLKIVGQFLSKTLEDKVLHVFDQYELVMEPSRAIELLKGYLIEPRLACDIETTGLYLGRAEILTIAFARDEYNAFTIACHEDYMSNSKEMIDTLKQFFKRYKGRYIFHNGLFDVKHMVYNWYMTDFSDTVGMREGINYLRFDDTMIMAYCALNSTDRPSLGLKGLSRPLLGDYAEDVKNARLIPLNDLALYNSKDVAGTWYVFRLFEEQLKERVYIEIMEPSLKPLLKMMLNGLPIDLSRVAKASETVEAQLMESKGVLETSDFVHESVLLLRHMASLKYNETHKKQKEPHEFDLEFNPNSSNQLRTLLYDVMEFEPIEFTDTGAPKADRASLQEFISISENDPDKLETLKALVSISEASIVQNTFLSAFLELSIQQPQGATLHGSLTLGGTQSGRLSSKDPNLQNMPSGSTYGKAIKNCFVAPEGWVFAYADFSALNIISGAMVA